MPNDFDSGGSSPHRQPPEGVIKGENVHPDSEPDEIFESKVNEVVNQMKTKGGVYDDMTEEQLRSKAIELVEERE